MANEFIDNNFDDAVLPFRPEFQDFDTLPILKVINIVHASEDS